MVNILILKNTRFPIDPQIRRAISTLQEKTLQEFFVDYRDTNFYTGHGAWVTHDNGLSGLVADKLWIDTETPRNTFHISVFVYEPPADIRTAGWVFPTPLGDKTIAVSIPVRQEWGDWLERAFMHEICHALIRRAHAMGVPHKELVDTLDQYKENINELLDENLAKLEPHWPLVTRKTPKIALYGLWIQALLVKVGLLKKRLENANMEPTEPLETPMKDRSVKLPEKPVEPEKEVVDGSRLDTWADAIEAFEKAPKEWNNPGALRWSPFQDGTYQGTSGNFATFDTYEKGRKALLHQLRIAAEGKSNVYKPSDSLLQFFSKYAPSHDGNSPRHYAEFVAQRLGVDKNYKIKNLL